MIYCAHAESLPHRAARAGGTRDDDSTETYVMVAARFGIAVCGDQTVWAGPGRLAGNRRC
jgi:hypothetical protein